MPWVVVALLLLLYFGMFAGIPALLRLAHVPLALRFIIGGTLIEALGLLSLRRRVRDRDFRIDGFIDLQLLCFDVVFVVGGIVLMVKAALV